MQNATFSAVFASFAVLALPGAAGSSEASTSNCTIVPAIPEASAATPIRAALSGDSTAALQEALDRLKPGTAAQLAPGVYKINKALMLRVPGIRLYGSRATLYSTSDHEGGLMIQADQVGVFDLTLDQDSHARQSTPWAGGISIYSERDGVVQTVRGSVIEHNTVKHAAAAGIFVYRADRFVIADNTVWRSLADGIHVTSGSKDGRIIGNNVSQTGDDLIAIVSYAGDAKVSTASDRYRDWTGVRAGIAHNILISNNQVSDQYWGRGISVVGGEQVTLSKNRISRSPMAAAIYIERESSYKTYGVHDVLVRDNSLSQVQTDTPQYQPYPGAIQLTGHGAIEISSLQDADELSEPQYRTAFSIERVSLIDNDIKDARFAGIRIGVGAKNTVSEVLVRGNTLTGVTQQAIIEKGEGLPIDAALCVDNRVNGVSWPRRCEHSQGRPPSAMRVARGATLSCRANGQLAAVKNTH